MKIAILSSDQKHMELIQKDLLEHSKEHEIAFYKNEAPKLQAITYTDHADCIIFDGLHCGFSELAELEKLIKQYPQVSVIVLGINPSPDYIINALRIGIQDVLSLPFDKNHLLQAISRVERKLKINVKADDLKAKVIAFISSKGGSGTTFLATNLGYVLAKEESKNVAFVDLNQHFGDAIFFVSTKPPLNNLADVSENIDRLDEALLSAYMVNILPNYALLAASVDPEKALYIKPDHIEKILNLMKDKYDYVILDISNPYSANSLKALDCADFIFPIIQENIPSIHNSRELIETIQKLGYKDKQLCPLLNQYEKGGDIDLKDVESSIGLKVFKTIPNGDEVVIASVNQGVPIYKLAKEDPVSKALCELAHIIVSGKQADKKSWLADMFDFA